MQNKLSRKALVLTFRHPYGATDMMAASIAAALKLNGYDATIATMYTSEFGQQLASALSDSDLELVISTGVSPLKVILNQERTFLWRFIPKHVLFVTIIVDALPYDFKTSAFVSFMDDFPRLDNLVIVSYEKNIAGILSAFSGKKVYHMPTGATLVPFLREEPEHTDRLMFWGSVEAELAKTDHTSDLLTAIRSHNRWNLSEQQIRKVTDFIIGADEPYALGALSQALDIPVDVMLRNQWIDELCIIDSAIKRYRRAFLIESLQDFPLDIYGKNWEKYVGPASAIRLRQPEPDHNLAFGHICQHYAGVVNIDPNWGDGTNERAITALTMGVRVATNKNKRIENTVGCYQYSLNRDSIRAACSQALNGIKPVAPLAEATWEYLIGRFLMEVSADIRSRTLGRR